MEDLIATCSVENPGVAIFGVRVVDQQGEPLLKRLGPFTADGREAPLVFIVDDQEEGRNMHRRNLEHIFASHPIVTRGFVTNDEALAAIAEGANPALAILDVVMPDSKVTTV